MTHWPVLYLGVARERDPIDLRTILQSALQSGLPDPFSFQIVTISDERSIETSVERGKRRALARIAKRLEEENGRDTIIVTLIPLIETCDWHFTFQILAVAANGRSTGYAATKMVPMPGNFGSKQRGAIWQRKHSLGEVLDSVLCISPRQFAYLCQRGPLYGLSDGKFSDQKELVEVIAAVVSQLR